MYIYINIYSCGMDGSKADGGGFAHWDDDTFMVVEFIRADDIKCVVSLVFVSRCPCKE